MTTSSTESNQGEQPIDPLWAHDELRLALAMRGGVSLAVWIGGATAEIDTLCRAPNAGGGFWSRLTNAAGYENVIVDVMSGASAGGLNAVIGAAAATYGFSLDALRDTWLELGSLSHMVRTADRSGPGDGMSLLEGDEYFLAKLQDRLTDLVESSEASTPRRIDVTLAATLLEPISVEQTRNNADTTQLRYVSTFRFRHGSPAWSDFPNDDAGRSAALARLALAGRATSSFPAAFEAAAVHAPRPHSFIDFPAPSSENVEMTGVFGEATATGRMFCVMDGGVLDNIPIARAIDAIVDAPADRPTRRVLVYVQPGSSGTSASAPVEEPDRSTAAVLTAIFRTRVQEETIAGDLRQIEEHNARVRRSRLSATGTIRQLTDSAVVGSAQPPSPRYVSQRASQEASDVAALLADPIGTLGGDPFPRLPDQESTFTDRCWRAPLSAVWTPAWAEQLPFELAGELETLINESISTRGHALTVGVGPLRRLIHLLIDASRALARCQDTLGAGVDPNELKGALYRLLAAHAEIVERPRQWAWVTLAALRDESAWTPSAITRIEELCAGSDQLVGVVDYLDHPAAGSASATPLAAADGVMRARLNNLVAGLAVPPAGEDVRELILERLCTHADSMASAPLNEELLANLAEQGDLGAVVLAWVRRPQVNMNLPPRQLLATVLGGANAGPGWAGRSLAVLERATYDPGTAGDLGSWPIDFVRLSGANQTPLAAAFPRLLEELGRTEPDADICERLAATPPPLSTTSKLAGNELMNFSAFLRDRWRSNDWMWGRLDAVVTLVETLVEPGRLRALATAMSPESPVEGQVELLMARFRRIVTTSGTVTATDEWSAFLLETAWLPRCDDISTAFSRLLANDPDNPPDLGPLRAALVAARQWEILAVLLPLGANMSLDDQGTPVAPQPISPQELVRAANEYWVGVETLGNPRTPDDGKLVRDLTNAARTMLAKSTSGPVGKVAGLLAPVVGLLSGVWLQKTRPKVIAAGLVGLGVAGLTLPAAFAAADPLAAMAGPAAVLFLAGVLIAAMRSRSLGFLIAVIAVVVAILAALSAGLVVLAVSASVVALVMLIAGAGLVALIRLRPPFPR